jgi:hypothetical protein
MRGYGASVVQKQLKSFYQGNQRSSARVIGAFMLEQLMGLSEKGSVPNVPDILTDSAEANKGGTFEQCSGRKF